MMYLDNQFVFTVPKILRPYFKNDKRLYGEVSRLIFELLSGFFNLAARRDLQCACVASYQSFGEFARFHPHWHVLVLEGGFDQWGRFVYLPLVSMPFAARSANKGSATIPPPTLSLGRPVLPDSMKARSKLSRASSSWTSLSLTFRPAERNWSVGMEAIIEWAAEQQSALPEVRGPPIPKT
jgi:hypothetical protein